MEERKSRIENSTVYPIRCSDALYNRFRNLHDKLADRGLMFKFDGNHYAVFSADINDRTQFTDFTLTLEDVELYAERLEN